MNSANTDTNPAWVAIASPSQVKATLEKEILIVFSFM